MAEGNRTNRVQVAFGKTKPLNKYVSLAKKFLHEQGEVQLSALGLAISTAVTVSEILKKEGWAVEAKIQTGLEVTTQDNTTKTKLEVTLKKSDKFDALYEAQQAQQAAAAAAAATTEAAA